MKNTLTALIAATFASVTFAASNTAMMPEAMKSGDVKPQAAAQAQVEARSMGASNSAAMPEAMRHSNQTAEANAEGRNATKRQPSITPDEQMANDYKKL